MANISFNNWKLIELTSLQNEVEQTLTTFDSLFSGVGSASLNIVNNTTASGSYFGSSYYDVLVKGNHFIDGSSTINFYKFLYTNTTSSLDIRTNLSISTYSGSFSGYMSKASYTSSTGDSFVISGKFNFNANGDLTNSKMTHIEVISNGNTIDITGNIKLNSKGDITGGTVSGLSLITSEGYELTASGLSAKFSTIDSLMDPAAGHSDLSELFDYITKSNDKITGSANNDRIASGDGDDIINGGLGADDMIGGKGNDTYFVDDAGDVITENTNEGTDTVLSSISYTLGNDVEKLTLTDGSKNGGTAKINGTGNGLNNTIIGNAGNNIIDGADGVDKLKGGKGDDQYTVDLIQAGSTPSKYKVKLQDTVSEASNAGDDTLVLRGSFNHLNASSIKLDPNLEHLDASTTGATKLNLTGNASSNIITGNDADNIINGKSGSDSLIGGLGDDSYLVKLIYAGTGPTKTAVLQDSITELSSEGIDSLILRGNLSKLKLPSEIALTGELANIENLDISATASSKLNITGNGLDNTLIGNNGINTLTGLAGNDTLDGKKGADTMIGGTGDDLYFIDHKKDVVTELVGEGNDTINSKFNYDLSNTANVENLTLLGSAAINATGDSNNNILTGNTGKNLLNGAAGNDTLIGGKGNDKLIGGLDADTFTWLAGDEGKGGKPSKDKILDFSLSQNDKLNLDGLLVGESAGASNLENYLDITTSTKSGVISTEIRISTDGNFSGGNYSKGAEDAHIQLTGVDLFTESGMTTEAALIQDLFNNGNLIVGA